MKRIFLSALLSLLAASRIYASFIETSVGTAVVNDATATYYNPASLTLLKKPQLIALGSTAYLQTHFTGQSIQSATGFTQSGTATTQTHYYLPAFYSGIPITNKSYIGIAVVSNFFNGEVDDNSILRYVKSNNNIKNIDLVAAVGIKANNTLSVGAGINFSYATILLQPISGFPSLNIPDSQSHNQANGTGIGGDIGVLLTPRQSTIIGFNYRSAIAYQLQGSSVFNNNTSETTSHNYYFTFWTPARSALSISQLATSNLGFISTIQYIQWNIFKKMNIHGIATQINSQPIIVNATIPFHLHNSWLFTLGSHYRINPKWVIRIAGTYSESPGNTHYQVANGNSIILGASTGYTINPHFTIDGSYAHVFTQNTHIDINTERNIVTGVNKSSRDAVSLKLTANI